MTTLFVGAIIWALAMAASAWLGLTLREWATNDHIFSVVTLFFIGALVAFPPAIWLAGQLARGWSGDRRFATAFLGLATATIGATAAIYALQYRLYYSEWHDDHLSLRWAVEVVVTALAAAYQFAVMGMPLYLPLGFFALFATSYWFARRSD